MIDGIHDRGDALDDEERDEHQRERQRADDRGREQHHAGEDADERRDQRPPESRCVSRPDRRDQSDNAADQEQPADEDGEGERRDQRHQDRDNAEDDEDDTFDQKQHPMLMDRARDRTAHRSCVGLVVRFIVMAGSCGSDLAVAPVRLGKMQHLWRKYPSSGRVLQKRANRSYLPFSGVEPLGAPPRDGHGFDG